MESGDPYYLRLTIGRVRFLLGGSGFDGADRTLGGTSSQLFYVTRDLESRKISVRILEEYRLSLACTELGLLLLTASLPALPQVSEYLGAG